MRPILLSAVAVAIVALYAMPAAAQTTDQGDTAEVEFEDQTMEGSSVTVVRATLPQGGFVVIYDASQATQDPNQQDPNQQDPNQQDPNQDNQTTGQDVLGSSEYLEAGTHNNVRITITTGTTGTGGGGTGNDTGTGTTGTGSELTLTAMLHLDTNNNRQFDGEDGGQEDTSYSGNGGGTVADQARVTMEGQGTDDNQTDDGLDQPGDDGFPDDGEDAPVDGDEDTPGLGVVALLAVVGAVAALRRR